MFCRKCGAELPEGSRFCEVCGAEIISVTNQQADTQINPQMSQQINQAVRPVANRQAGQPNPSKSAKKSFPVGAVVGFMVLALIVAGVAVVVKNINDARKYGDLMAIPDDIPVYEQRTQDSENSNVDSEVPDGAKTVSGVTVVRKDSNTTEKKLEGDWPKDGFGSKIPKPWFGKVVTSSESNGVLVITMENVEMEDFTDYKANVIAKGFNQMGGIISFVDGTDDNENFYTGMNSDMILITLQYDGENVLEISVKNWKN